MTFSHVLRCLCYFLPTESRVLHTTMKTECPSEGHVPPTCSCPTNAMKPLSKQFTNQPRCRQVLELRIQSRLIAVLKLSVHHYNYDWVKILCESHFQNEFLRALLHHKRPHLANLCTSEKILLYSRSVGVFLHKTILYKRCGNEMRLSPHT